MPDNRIMEVPIDCSFGFVKEDGSHSLMFVFKKLSGAYKAVGLSSNEESDNIFNPPPIVA